MDIAWRIFLVILLIIFNGFFVASEYSLVNSKRERLTNFSKKKKNASLVLAALENLSQYVSAIQVGITITSLGIGWLGEPAIASLFSKLFSQVLPQSIAIISSHTLAIIVSFIIITFFQIVFGELIPRSVALQKAEPIAMTIVTPLHMLTRILNPFIALLSSTSNLILRTIGLPYFPSELPPTEEEIKMILSQSAKSGTIERGELEMMYKVFQFGDIAVRFIMVPRTELLAFERSEIISDILPLISKSAHSRYPVYKESVDNIIGYIHIKDILANHITQKKMTTIKDSLPIHETLYVPEEKRADDVLLDMRKRRIPLAVVTDEYGGTAGIVTKEDITEELTGEIHDEFESAEAHFKRLKDGSYRVDGMVSVEQFEQRLRVDLDDERYNTIGGLVFGQLGHEPEVGDVIILQNLQITVHKMDGRRVDSVIVKVNKNENL